MSSEEIITSAPVILDCLKEISRNASPVFLSVCDDADSAVYETRFQSLKPQKHHIILHQVLPGDWRDSIAPQTKLEIRSCMKLGHVRFRGFLSPLDDSGINPYCKLTFPARIYRRQDRDYFRVALNRAASTVALQLDTDTAFAGKCRDVSVAGAQLALPPAAGLLQIGQVIEACELAIKGQLTLQCCGKICSLQHQEKEIIAGIQFLDLTPAQSRQIATALNRIERQNING